MFLLHSVCYTKCLEVLLKDC